MENKDENQKKINEYIAKAKTLIQEHEKLVIPIAIGVVVVIAAILIIVGRNKKQIEETVTTTEETASTIDESLLQEPLEQDAYEDVKNLMNSFYQALADGDMDAVRSIKDHTDDTEIITYEKKSEFIESYNNLVCYTKKGVDEGAYFVYEYYEVKFYDIDTMAPGLNTWYVYTKEDGSLAIDGDMDESITAYLKIVTSLDDVVDLFNKVDVKYNEAIDADEALNTFLTDLPNQIKTSVGVALASLESETEEVSTEEEITETTEEATSEEQIEDQTVNEQVKTVDTVNVRKSDSEEADKLGKAEKGLELTRLETKVNGWSKVIFEGQEAYIKSDYLEVVSTNDTAADTTTDTTTSSTTSMEAQTNVNVRNAANETADKIGVAQAQQSYTVIEKLDDGWMKIDYNGQEGFVKSEYFR